MAISNTNYTTEEINNLFERAEKIFFIGIGGISMSGIATFCAYTGKQIYGYDRERSEETARLEHLGKIKYYSTPDNVTGMDIVVYTNAIDEKNHEYAQARRKKIPLISRANFLGYIISLHKHSIGISGMHGKSTTVSMLCHIFESAGKNPTVFCGANMISQGSSFRHGGREYCIFEACEYQNSFLSLSCREGAVLNIDYDHPDFFGSIKEIVESFEKYIKNAHRVYLNCENDNIKSLCHKNAITFGFSKNAIYRAEVINGGQRNDFKVYKKGEYLCTCSLGLQGKHHILDALCAFAIAHTHGIPAQDIKEGLLTFKGSRRRMEFIKKSDTGADIFEDYAHHPTEIQASLSSLKKTGYSRIFCVFQPHTYSRTYYLYKEFTKCFKDSHKLIVAPTFAAREENIYELSECDFARASGGEYIEDISRIARAIREERCDCIVIMGAGDLGTKIKKLI